MGGGQSGPAEYLRVSVPQGAAEKWVERKPFAALLHDLTSLFDDCTDPDYSLPPALYLLCFKSILPRAPEPTAALTLVFLRLISRYPHPEHQLLHVGVLLELRPPFTARAVLPCGGAGARDVSVI